MNKTSISDLVKDKRKENKWSQQKLAEKTGLSIDTIRGIETSRNINPTLYVMRKLQDVLEIKIEI